MRQPDQRENVVTVAIGIDESSSNALDVAAGLAARRNVPCRVVHVQALPDSTRPSSILNHLSDRSRGLEALALAAEWIGSAGDHPATETRLLNGDPRHRLVIESADTSVMVVGRRTPERTGQRRSPNVGGWLVDHAECPLIVVPTTIRDQHSSDHPVVVVLGPDTDERALLEYAFAEAATSGRDVKVVHRVADYDLACSVAPHVARSEADARAILHSHTRPPTVSFVTEPESLRISESVLATAALVIARQSPGSLHPVNWGQSHIHRLLAHADCPVVVLPAASPTPSERRGAIGHLAVVR